MVELLLSMTYRSTSMKPSKDMVQSVKKGYGSMKIFATPSLIQYVAAQYSPRSNIQLDYSPKLFIIIFIYTRDMSAVV